jgi:mitogen-activated protein kinase kinase kinase 5
LETLIRALKDYIIDQNKETLKKSLSQLKKQLDFDSTAIDHLHYALYKFQDAVIAVLRGVSIKPHWMFALDNLVRNSVHVGLMILSPELGRNLAGQDRDDGGDEEDEVDELSNSGVSTVNSTKVKHHSNKEHEESKFLMDQVRLLRIENAKLLNELLESQRNFQGLIKSIPHDQGLFSEALRNLTQQLSSFTRNFERSFSFGYHSDDLNQNRKSSLSNDASPSLEDSPPGKKLSIPLFKNPQLKSPFNARQSHDLRVAEWLNRHGFDDDARSSVAIADFTYEDFIYESDKDDIRRIGLR